MALYKKKEELVEAVRVGYHSDYEIKEFLKRNKCGYLIVNDKEKIGYQIVKSTGNIFANVGDWIVKQPLSSIYDLGYYLAVFPNKNFTDKYFVGN